MAEVCLFLFVYLFNNYMHLFVYLFQICLFIIQINKLTLGGVGQPIY